MAESADIAADGLRLREEFPPVSTAEWEAAIRSDLNGADYEKKLIWHSENGIDVRPYYRSAQSNSNPGAFPFVRGNGSQAWQIEEPETPPPADAIRADRFAEQGATTLQELGYAVAEGVDRMAALTSSGISVDEAAKSIGFVFSVGPSFFFEIAKFRAARLMWAQAVSAFHPESETSCLMRIHARTALWNKSLYDPYANLLRASMEGLAASIGGVDSLNVQPFGFAPALALNVQRILKEEAHVDRVADPGGGSYYLEALTAALARESWKLFQEVESLGGFEKARASVEAAIAESRTAKEKAVSSRRKVLVGVNNYPNTEEILEPDDKAPATGWRAAQVFESIRRRTEAYARANGRRPSVLLLQRGDVKMRRARANFCHNLFGCGGFAIRESEALEDADLVILCSSDAEYLTLAREICAQTTNPVLVAGYPKDQIPELNAAGISGYVHAMANAADILTEWQGKLGL